MKTKEGLYRQNKPAKMAMLSDILTFIAEASQTINENKQAKIEWLEKRLTRELALASTDDGKCTSIAHLCFCYK